MTRGYADLKQRCTAQASPRARQCSGSGIRCALMKNGYDQEPRAFQISSRVSVRARDRHRPRMRVGLVSSP